MTRSSRLLAAVLAVAALAACSPADSEQPSPTRETVTTTATTRPPPTTTSTTTTVPPTTTTTVPSTSTTGAPVDLSALRPPSPASDPAGLAAQIQAAEGTIRDAASTEEQVASAALAQQVAYRQLGIHPEWDAAVLGAIPEALRRPVQLNVAARREFRSMHRQLSSVLPAWRIVAPAPHDELLASFHEAEATFGIPWKYLAAIHLVETGTGRIRGTSTAGAQGPMQFMPATWAAYGGGGDINNTHDAIMGAARYLAANNAAADIDNALWHYNHSDRYVRGVKLYADLIAEHARASLAYYHWGVWYLSDSGDVYLPVGYDEPAPVPVAEYLQRL
ncbi:MAG: transglycosylase SLT domain-containing protein [Acidimicrobiales bacterium]